MKAEARTAVGWLGALALFAGCSDERPPNPQSPPTAMLTGVSFRHYGSAGPPVEGTAARVVVDRNSDQVRGEQVTLTFPARPGRPAGAADEGPTVLKAGVARLEQSQGAVQGEDGVELRTASGLVATSQTARYDRRTGDVAGKTRVQVVTPGGTLSGDRYRFQASDEHLALEGRVQSTVQGTPP